MSYHFTKTVRGTMDEVRERVTAALAARGFGVLTTIDVAATMKKKLGIAFRPYVILGACNPEFAHRALELEDKIGTMLPCNVILQEKAKGEVEVSAVDPAASMAAIANPGLDVVAEEVRTRLRQMVEGL